jgi:hypothetical protein
MPVNYAGTAGNFTSPAWSGEHPDTPREETLQLKEKYRFSHMD